MAASVPALQDSESRLRFSGGGLLDACSIRTAEDDDPNSLRFCDAFSYPTPYRHEFKVSGNYPLPWQDLMVAGTIIANAGGYAGDTLSETRSFTRTSDTFAGPFCRLGLPDSDTTRRWGPCSHRRFFWALLKFVWVTLPA